MPCMLGVPVRAAGDLSSHAVSGDRLTVTTSATPSPAARREARLLRHQPRLRPPQPHGGGDQPGPRRISGRHPVASQPVRPLARAADPAGGADGPRLRCRRDQSAGRQHRDRWPGDAGAGRPGACRGHGAARRRGPVAARRAMSPPCSATPRRSPCWRPGGPGVPGLLLANFTWADIYAPYARAAGGDDARRLVADLRHAYRQATAVFRAEPALRMAWLPGQIDVGMVANPGRDRARAAPAAGLEREREARLFLRRPVWPERPRLGGPGEIRRQGNPLRRLSSRAGRPPEEPPPRARRGMARRRPDRLDRRPGGQGRLRHRLRGDGLRHADHLSPRAGASPSSARSTARSAPGAAASRSPPATSRHSGWTGPSTEPSSLGPLTPPYPTDGADRVAGHLARLCRAKPTIVARHSAG